MYSNGCFWSCRTSNRTPRRHGNCFSYRIEITVIRKAAWSTVRLYYVALGSFNLHFINLKWNRWSATSYRSTRIPQTRSIHRLSIIQETHTDWMGHWTHRTARLADEGWSAFRLGQSLWQELGQLWFRRRSCWPFLWWGYCSKSTAFKLAS